MWRHSLVQNEFEDRAREPDNSFYHLQLFIGTKLANDKMIFSLYDHGSLDGRNVTFGKMLFVGRCRMRSIST